MMKLNHPALVFISGIIWFTVGLYLLALGLNLVTGMLIPGNAQNHYYLLDSLASVFGGRDQAALVIIASALLIGHFKGKYVLGKSARSGIERLLMMATPIHLSQLYSKKYYILLGSMVLLGMSIKFFGVPADFRGFVDIAIGSALINGALIYFRSAYGLRNTPTCGT
jgi:hypothetical protein